MGPPKSIVKDYMPIVLPEIPPFSDKKIMDLVHGDKDIVKGHTLLLDSPETVRSALMKMKRKKAKEDEKSAATVKQREMPKGCGEKKKSSYRHHRSSFVQGQLRPSAPPRDISGEDSTSTDDIPTNQIQAEGRVYGGSSTLKKRNRKSQIFGRPPVSCDTSGSSSEQEESQIYPKLGKDEANGGKRRQRGKGKNHS